MTDPSGTRQKRCFIVIQCTNVSNTPLCYTPVRSYCSANERLEQVGETLKSIRQRDEDAAIILAEVSDLTSVQEDMVKTLVSEQKCQYINLSMVPDIANQRDSLFKGPTELRVLVHLFAQKMIPECDLLFKISGRYTLTDDFDLSQFSKNAITAYKFDNGGVSTVLYSVPECLFDTFQNMLKECIKQTWNQFISIEEKLFQGCQSMQVVSPIGVQGLVGCNGTLYRI
jgi:hypothetical protein